ncbi:MAG: molybdopterin converting factor subunit 1 [Pseudomonadota bacterium]|nr:molybdopterin converting factor subunit 1 [Pseudomonadota bacterium]
MKILYFAWVRDKVGKDSEVVDIPPNIATAGAFVKWFRERGPVYAEIIDASDTVKMAINQEYAGDDHPITNDDEVALFPPVTGGVHD